MGVPAQNLSTRMGCSCWLGWRHWIRRLRPSRAGITDGESSLNAGLLRDASLAGNLLDSFLAGDRSRIPYSTLKDDASAGLLPASVKKLGAEALQVAQAGNSILGWNAIYRVFGDLPVEDGQRELMESAIQNIDLPPLAGNLDACETLLHAASMQAAALRTIAVTEHLSDQVAKIAALLGKRSRDGRKLTDDERQFVSSLIQVAINLLWSATNSVERTAEFARLFTRIADALPKRCGGVAASPEPDMAVRSIVLQTVVAAADSE